MNTHEIEKALNSREVIPLGQSAALISDADYSGGFIFNLPYGEKSAFENPVKSYWKTNKTQQPEKLLEKPDGTFYVALSSNRNGKIRISAVYSSSDFELSKEIRILIYICIFISILLIVFLLFSFFRDPVVTLQKRIKKIQLGLIENYIDGKEKKEWGDLARQLRVRKNDLSDEIIKSLHVHSKKRRKELSDYLDKNWDEIFSIFEAKAGNTEKAPAASGVVSGPAELTGASIAEIRKMLEEVLQNRNFVAPVVAAAVKAVEAAAPEDAEEAEELDEVEELAEEAEDAEELDEVEELSEEAEDAEELDEVEELAEEAEDAEELDEVEELAEEADDAEELDEVEELAEEAADTEELDEVEELEGEAEDAEEAEEVEDLDDAEELDELDEVEELDDAEDIDELEDAEELDELDEVEELEGADEVEKDPVDIIHSLVRTPLDYVPSDETYFASDLFPNVDNLYAEELRIGSEIRVRKNPSLEDMFYESKLVDLKTIGMPEFVEAEPAAVETESEPPVEEPVTPVDEPITEDIVDEDTFEDVDDFIDDVIEDEPEIAEPIEELTEEVPEVLSSSDLVLTNFAENFALDMPELEAVPSAENVIYENDGVYSISENLEYTNIVQDPDFKQLVDSILK